MFLNAGVIDRVALLDDAQGRWQTTLDVDLRSVIVGVTIAAEEARKAKKEGRGDSSSSSTSMSIVVVASAGGLYPMPSAPVYAAAKGGLVHFVRSAARGIFKETGARLSALCPEQVDTALVAGVAEAGLLPGKLEQLLTVDAVADAAVALGEDRNAVGTALMVHVSGALLEAKTPRGFLVDDGGRFSLRAKSSSSSPSSSSSSSSSPPPPSAASRARAAWAQSASPASNRAVVVQRPGTDFRAATEVVSMPLPIQIPRRDPIVPRAPAPRLPSGLVLIRRTFAGVNASDVNYAAGRYAAAPGVGGDGGGNGGGGGAIPGTRGAEPPFGCGFEAVGVVAAAADDVSSFKPGDAVAQLSYDGFAELSLARASRCFPISRPDAAAVALLTSGLTASIGLEVACKPRKGETFLVTAAAGGTGQFVVQLAAAAGCRVVATCGGPEKAEMLRGLGAERVIDYRAENVGEVLKREFPQVWKAFFFFFFFSLSFSLFFLSFFFLSLSHTKGTEKKSKTKKNTAGRRHRLGVGRRGHVRRLRPLHQARHGPHRRHRHDPRVPGLGLEGGQGRRRRRGPPGAAPLARRDGQGVFPAAPPVEGPQAPRGAGAEAGVGETQGRRRRRQRQGPLWKRKEVRRGRERGGGGRVAPEREELREGRREAPGRRRGAGGALPGVCGARGASWTGGCEVEVVKEEREKERKKERKKHRRARRNTTVFFLFCHSREGRAPALYK